MKNTLTFSKDGHEVTVDTFYLSRAYGGMLEGRITAEKNARIRSGARAWLEKNWGQREVFEVPPPPGPSLPPLQLIAWLVSSEPVSDPEAHGSHAFVIWYQHESTIGQSIAQLAKAALDGLAWKDVAYDFEY